MLFHGLSAEGAKAALLFHGLSAEGAKAVDTQTPDDPSFIYILGRFVLKFYIFLKSLLVHVSQLDNLENLL